MAQYPSLSYAMHWDSLPRLFSSDLYPQSLGPKALMISKALLILGYTSVALTPPFPAIAAS
jgi:hypothetical protein